MRVLGGYGWDVAGAAVTGAAVLMLAGIPEVALQVIATVGVGILMWSTTARNMVKRWVKSLHQDAPQVRRRTERGFRGGAREERGQDMHTVRERVANIVAGQLEIKTSEIREDASFIDELGADSLDLVELAMELEEEFDCEITNEDMGKMTTVQKAVAQIETLINEVTFTNNDATTG